MSSLDWESLEKEELLILVRQQAERIQQLENEKQEEHQVR